MQQIFTELCHVPWGRLLRYDHRYTHSVYSIYSGELLAQKGDRRVAKKPGDTGHGTCGESKRTPPGETAAGQGLKVELGWTGKSPGHREATGGTGGERV